MTNFSHTRPLRSLKPVINSHSRLLSGERGEKKRKKTPDGTSQWNKARHYWSMMYNLHETQGLANDKRLSPVEFVLHRSSLKCSACNKASTDLHTLVLIPYSMQFDCVFCANVCVHIW